MKIIILLISMVLISGCSENVDAQSNYAKSTYVYTPFTKEPEEDEFKFHMLNRMKLRNELIEKYMLYFRLQERGSLAYKANDLRFLSDILRDQDQATRLYHNWNAFGQGDKF